MSQIAMCVVPVSGRYSMRQGMRETAKYVKYWTSTISFEAEKKSERPDAGSSVWIPRMGTEHFDTQDE